MTFASEAAKTNPRVQFFCTIETVGWMTDENDLSAGFDGTIITANDVNSDLLSRLGCDAVLDGMQLPHSFGDSINPQTFEYTADAIKFEFTETEDDDLQNIFRPLDLEGGEAVLSAALEYDSEDVRFKDTATLVPTTGSTIIIAGVEAIKLGTRTSLGFGNYSYPASTRGYLGTPRGNRTVIPSSLGVNAWGVDTILHDWTRYWHDKRIQLWMIPLSGAVTDAVRLYPGRLRRVNQKLNGAAWELTTVFDRWGTIRAVIPRPSIQSLAAETISFNAVYVDRHWRDWRITPKSSTFMSNFELWAMAFTYDYRNRVRGGTIGAITALLADRTQPQARQDADSNYLNHTLFDVDGHLLRAVYKQPDAEKTYREVRVELVNTDTYSGIVNEVAGTNIEDYHHFSIDIFNPTHVQFTLDSLLNDYKKSNFTVNNSIRRNPIDVLLMCFTSYNSEFWIGDAEALSTSTVFVATAAAPNWDTNQWAGYALHCVEGSNIGESRKIVSNTTDEITVTPAFTYSIDAGVGDEYQIRNSVYDVLPLGWGLETHNSQINIAAAENIRERFLSNAELGHFVISGDTQIEIRDMLVSQICKAYGITIVQDRVEGILTFRYSGVVVDDQLFDTFAALTTPNIINIKDLDYLPHRPIGKAEIEIRSLAKKLKYTRVEAPGSMGGGVTSVIRYVAAEGGAERRFDGATEFIPVIDEDRNVAYPETLLSTLSIQALFNDRNSVASLISLVRGRFFRQASPWPVTTINADLEKVSTILTGQSISISDTAEFNPPNPFTGTRGWDAVVGLVLSTKLILDDTNPGVQHKVQLRPAITYGLLAPAARVLSKGSDGSGDYFNIALDDFDVDNEDWDKFVLGDYIELRDITGALKDIRVGVSFDTIAGFDNTLTADPTQADPAFPRIYLATGAITATLATGDYLTFHTWDTAAVNTANMDKCTALATTGKQLGPNNDEGKRYI